MTEDKKKFEEPSILQMMANYAKFSGQIQDEQVDIETKKQKLDVVDALAGEVNNLRNFIQNRNSFGTEQSLNSIRQMCDALSLATSGDADSNNADLPTVFPNESVADEIDDAEKVL